jgi:acetyltransferase-like isoleucine patch superfamily enzyme
MAEALRKIYSKLRGRPMPDGIPSRVLVEFTASKALEAARGTISTISSGPALRFRASGTRLHHRHLLSLGRGVSLARGVDINSFGRAGVRLGDNVTVGAFTQIAASGVISEPGEFVHIGARTAVGSHNIIWGQGGVTIGSDCLLGPHVVIVSENHVHNDPAVPIRSQGNARAPVDIGDDCWIGAGARIMMGVTLGRGSVVGAGSVVTRDVPEFSVVVGVPARVIGTRNLEEDR